MGRLLLPCPPDVLLMSLVRTPSPTAHLNRSRPPVRGAENVSLRTTGLVGAASAEHPGDVIYYMAKGPDKGLRNTSDLNHKDSSDYAD